MPAYDKNDIQRRMQGAVESLKHDLAGLRTGLMLAQNGNDLLFRKPLPFHSSVPSEGPDSNAPWRKSSVAGH